MNIEAITPGALADRSSRRGAEKTVVTAPVMNSTVPSLAVEHPVADINGLRTFCRAAGHPSQPVIVLLHGFPSSSHMFRDLIPLLALLAETTRRQTTEGARHPERLNPDAWAPGQSLLDPPGSADRQLALFKDDQHNLPLFAAWQAFFRQHQPRTLVAWGRGDPFFGVPGAEAFRRQLADVRVELLHSGHFALEEDASRVADLTKQTF